MTKMVVEFTCDICGKTEKQNHGISADVWFPRPLLPQKWKAVMGQTICDDHEIKIVNKPKN